MDVVALDLVISSDTVGLTAAFYSAHRTAETAREGRLRHSSQALLRLERANRLLAVEALSDGKGEFDEAALPDPGVHVRV